VAFKKWVVFAREHAVNDLDFGTMRFEDDVPVTEKGTKVLSSKLPRELIEL
jgi:Xaa-Pro aminopeptidase